VNTLGTRRTMRTMGSMVALSAQPGVASVHSPARPQYVRRQQHTRIRALNPH
jgi:hypothetical protein